MAYRLNQSLFSLSQFSTSNSIFIPLVCFDGIVVEEEEEKEEEEALVFVFVVVLAFKLIVFMFSSDVFSVIIMTHLGVCELFSV
jgi:hypothetical protein